MDLDLLRRELKALRHRFFQGENVQTEMYAKAKECADLYNLKAKEVGKRMGVKPRLTTPDKILRQAEFLR
jgi:hypothetical protein